MDYHCGKLPLANDSLPPKVLLMMLTQLRYFRYFRSFSLLVVLLFAAMVSWCPEDSCGSQIPEHSSHSSHSSPNKTHSDSGTKPMDECCPCACNILLLCDQIELDFQISANNDLLFVHPTFQIIDQQFSPNLRPPRLRS